MKQVEADLGTKLDWVAVNHYNTGHPHVHIVVNGRDDTGGDLVINGDYLSAGLRERASELASLELGPVTEIEQTRKLSAEIDQDRFTRIDRAMVEEADARALIQHRPATLAEVRAKAAYATSGVLEDEDLIDFAKSLAA